jgi:hypothetical protein
MKCKKQKSSSDRFGELGCQCVVSHALANFWVAVLPETLSCPNDNGWFCSGQKVKCDMLLGNLSVSLHVPGCFIVVTALVN